MKPIQLMPEAVAVKEVTPGSGSAAAAIIVGGLVMLGVGGYFAMAAVGDVKEATANTVAQTTTTQQETTGVQAQILESGKKRDWTKTAADYESYLVTTLDKRIDYALLLRELYAVKPDQGPFHMWFSMIKVTNPEAGGGGGDEQVIIEGGAQSFVEVASLVTRLNGTDTMDGAKVISYTYETAKQPSKAAGHVFIMFRIGASLTPKDPSNATLDTNAATVGNTGGDGEDSSQIGMGPEPGYSRRKAATKKEAPAPAPLSSFEKVAKQSASYGGDA